MKKCTRTNNTIRKGCLLHRYTIKICINQQPYCNIVSFSIFVKFFRPINCSIQFINPYALRLSCSIIVFVYLFIGSNVSVKPLANHYGMSIRTNRAIFVLFFSVPKRSYRNEIFCSLVFFGSY